MVGSNLQYVQLLQHSELECDIRDTHLEIQSETIAAVVDWNLGVVCELGHRVTSGDSPGACIQPDWLCVQPPKPEPWRSPQRWGSGEPTHLCAIALLFVPQ